MHRVAFPLRWAQVVFLSSSLLVTQNSHAYDCQQADLLLALDASDSVSSASVRDAGLRVLSVISAIQRRFPKVRLLEAVAFTGKIEHSSRHWGQATSLERAQALARGFSNLRISLPQNTSFRSVLTFAKTRFEDRSAQDQRDRRPVLIVVTDGMGESAVLESLGFIDDLRGIDGFRPGTAAPVPTQVRVAQLVEQSYFNALDSFYAIGADAIAIPVGEETFDPTIDDLTTDAVEEIRGLERQIEWLIRCIV